MSLDLPEPIGIYLGAENSDDTALLSACFSADATVHDESRTYTGIEAIQAWKTEVKVKTGYTVEPLSAFQRDGKTVVSAKVAGNFPNSPVTLEYTFTVRDDRIVALEIR